MIRFRSSLLGPCYQRTSPVLPGGGGLFRTVSDSLRGTARWTLPSCRAARATLRPRGGAGVLTLKILWMVHKTRLINSSRLFDGCWRRERRSHQPGRGHPAVPAPAPTPAAGRAGLGQGLRAVRRGPLLWTRCDALSRGGGGPALRRGRHKACAALAWPRRPARMAP